jgi:hypothetical protein
MAPGFTYYVLGCHVVCVLFATVRQLPFHRYCVGAVCVLLAGAAPLGNRTNEVSVLRAVCRFLSNIRYLLREGVAGLKCCLTRALLLPITGCCSGVASHFSRYKNLDDFFFRRCIYLVPVVAHTNTHDAERC